MSTFQGTPERCCSSAVSTSATTSPYAPFYFQFHSMFFHSVSLFATRFKRCNTVFKAMPMPTMLIMSTYVSCSTLHGLPFDDDSEKEKPRVSGLWHDLLHFRVGSPSTCFSQIWKPWAFGWPLGWGMYGWAPNYISACSHDLGLSTQVISMSFWPCCEVKNILIGIDVHWITWPDHQYL